jgi:DNA polymerase delta subunit 1
MYGGFQNNEQFTFMQLNFKNVVARRMVNGRLKRTLPDESIKYKVYESNLDPVLRLMHRTGIQSTGGWIPATSVCVRISRTWI